MSERPLPVPVRAVTFDLGDTLWHFPDPPPAEAIVEHITMRIRRLLEAWDVRANVSPEELDRRLRVARDQATREADATDLRSPDYVSITAQVAREAALDLTRDQAGELWQAQNTGGPFLGRYLFDDAITTLDWLREHDVRIAAVTNRSHGGATFLEELRQDGLLSYFDAVISSDQVGYRKPHPELFRRSLQALDVDAAATVHVGDRPDADVAGAHRAGIAAVWMRYLTPSHLHPRTAEEQPDAAIERLAELRGVLHVRR